MFHSPGVDIMALKMNPNEVQKSRIQYYSQGFRLHFILALLLLKYDLIIKI